MSIFKIQCNMDLKFLYDNKIRTQTTLQSYLINVFRILGKLHKTKSIPIGLQVPQN